MVTRPFPRGGGLPEYFIQTLTKSRKLGPEGLFALGNLVTFPPPPTHTLRVPLQAKLEDGCSRARPGLQDYANKVDSLVGAGERMVCAL